MEMAKSRNITTFVVGHVTKEGAIAGPKVMEHMVDTVLYFEGERGNPIRLLRAHKNRFGSAQEMGLFEMSHRGLEPVENPSEIFLRQRAEGPGGVVVTSMEGTRPILVEVQALAVPSVYSSPRRTTLGFDANRTSMICAVLEARAGVDLTGQDLFVNVAGGVRIQETGIDLGVALALASTTRRRAIASDLVCIGEVGLSGEVRSVAQLELRLQEAEKLGFSTAVVPAVDRDKLSLKFESLRLRWVSTLQSALDEAGLA
jgi:DNA repair protein RadA/Sms